VYRRLWLAPSTGGSDSAAEHPDLDFAPLKVCIIHDCKGAGTDSTLRWIDIIKKYFPCGSIVLADHLGGHMSEVQEAFRGIGVHYFFFPKGVNRNHEPVR
jgi:hypothetical protein